MKKSRTCSIIAASLLMGIIPLTGCTPAVDAVSTIVLQRFSGISFENQTIKYDGRVHHIYVSGAPSFANVAYENNDNVSVGEHVVKATISAPDYETLVLEATLTITEADKEFVGLSFSPKTFDYDGEYHSLEVENVPEGASVVYSNNSQKDVGVYTVSATISKTGYVTKTLTAKLTIKGKQFEGITFRDSKVSYDGQKHYIYVDNLPSFASVTYENNGQSQLGKYVVKATITATGYEKLTLSATLTITDLKFFENIVWEDRLLFYTGKFQAIEYEAAYALPKYTDITYYLNDKKVDAIQVKEKGNYKIAMKLERSSYETETYVANVAVVDDMVGGTDGAKSAYSFSATQKYDDLYNEIMKGNFTMSLTVGDERFYPNGTTSRSSSIFSTYYLAGDTYFELTKSMNIYEGESLSETSYVVMKDMGDYVIKAEYEKGALYSLGRFPSYAYAENVVGRIGMVPFACLGKGDDGSFVNGVYGGSRDAYSTFAIDSAHNEFNIETRWHYFHPEFDHDEISNWTLKNVGNTKIEIPDFIDVSSIDVDELSPTTFVYQGIEYSFSDESSDEKKAMAFIDYNTYDFAFNKPGTYVLPAEIDGYPVSRLDYYYYYNYTQSPVSAEGYKSVIDEDPFSGYTFKLYIDDRGNYQGEYSDLGYIKNYSNLEKVYQNYGATLLYYDDWH